MITRRQFNALGLAATFIRTGAAWSQDGQFVTPLPVPELIDTSENSSTASLEIRRTQHAFVRGRPTAAYGVSASYLGPTVRLPASGQTKMVIKNRLGRPTTLHWHGLLVPGEVDGGPHNMIADGSTWEPTIKLSQPPCTAWYHAHPHGDTAHQVYGGVAGMLIVADGMDADRRLPATYGVDDLPLVLQDRSFADDGGLLYDNSMPTAMLGFYGDTIIVNGSIKPIAGVPAKLVRLRLLNGANASTYRLAFSDSRAFHICASDGGFLNAPLAMHDIMISPGERYEILVDFSDARSVDLLSLPYMPNVRGMMGMMMQRVITTQRRAFMRFVPNAKSGNGKDHFPAKLASLDMPNTRTVATRRNLSLDMMMSRGRGMGGGMMGRNGTMHAINGKPFDMERIDFTARRGTSEHWRVFAPDMPHPFHVHGTSFRILTLNGRPPPPELAGLKDTVLIEGEAELLLPFDNAANHRHPYMFHCHILEHEDGGMMGQFAVT